MLYTLYPKNLEPSPLIARLWHHHHLQLQFLLGCHQDHEKSGTTATQAVVPATQPKNHSCDGKNRHLHCSQEAHSLWSVATLARFRFHRSDQLKLSPEIRPPRQTHH
uniref:Uncharacterized protein n=1 Tax=Opuntia streptacantha TaxID=393608 RepID=A0A7C9B139_OPUST